MGLVAVSIAVLLPGAACGSSEPSDGGGGVAEAIPAAAGKRPLVREGQPGRRVLGGRWYFRLDDEDEGVRGRYMRQRSLAGWRAISVPYDWNGAERKQNRASVGWYRRELALPRAERGTRWIVRFEGAGHHSIVYLNGREIGRHSGNYLPFEADLRGLHRGRNRLVVRVSSLRTRDDLTHWREARFHRYGNGGWWNFGGIHREVTVRPARDVDIVRAQALPRMACAKCAARVQIRVLVRNLRRGAARPRVVARADGQTVQLPAARLAPGARRELVGEITIARPRLWDIRRGNLYGLVVRAVGTGASYRTSIGVRDVRKTADGRIFMNGRRLVLRGVSVHEDHPRVGSAWRAPQFRELLRRVDDLGASVVRAHYPLNPYVLEQLDRRGVMVWDAAPVNLVQNDRWEKRSVRRDAVRAGEETVLRDRGHPSVLVFSIADELPIPVRRAQQLFIRAAAARVRKLDPTRLVALDRVARYGAPDDAHPVFHGLDVLGINEYFGWYRGALPPRPPAHTGDLGSYFDTLHRQQPHAALFVTEFGAEANRRGSVREKGTYAFQSRYLREHLRAAASRPYLNGALVWVLKDFRVHSAWTGDNPKPQPPWNQKGILSARGRPKPAYQVVKRALADPPRASP
jgi:beta-glucuronidase